MANSPHKNNANSNSIMESYLNHFVKDLTVFEFGISLLTVIFFSYYCFRKANTTTTNKTFSSAAAAAGKPKTAVLPPSRRNIIDTSAASLLVSKSGESKTSVNVTAKVTINSSSSSSSSPTPTTTAQSPTARRSPPLVPLSHSHIYTSENFAPLSHITFPPPIQGSIRQWRSQNPKALVVSVAGRTDLTDDDWQSLQQGQGQGQGQGGGILALDMSHAEGSSEGLGSSLGKTLLVLHARGTPMLTSTALSQLNVLQVLDASHANIDKNCLNALTGSPSLKVLSLFGITTSLTAGGGVTLSPSLTHVDLGYCDIDDDAIATMPQLESIDVSGVTTKGLHGASFAKLEKLKTLKARNCPTLHATSMSLIHNSVDVNVFGCTTEVVQAVEKR